MTKRIFSLILSLIMLFSTTVPAFASDGSADVLTETVQDVEEAGESTKEEEFFENEKNEPDVDDSKNSNADAEDSKDSEADVEDSKDSNADVEAPEEGEADVEESPEPSEEPADAPAYKLDMPKVSKLTNTPEGVEISWREVSGAEKYRVFLLDEAGNWTELADTTATRYVWTGAQEGISYTFTVRCVSADGETFTSGFDKVGMSITYTSVQPDEDEADAEAPEEGEVDVEESEEGAADVEESEEGTSDAEELEEGEADVEDSVQTLAGLVATIAYPISDIPKVSKLLNTPEGVNISWNGITGAAKYRVFRLNESGGWTKLGDTTSTDYTWTGAKAGSFYVFTVRCISADGKSYTSDYDAGGMGGTYTPTQLETPGQPTLSSTPEGIKITWDAVPGAQKYRIFYKNAKGGWSKIADTTATSYLWTGAEDQKPYQFTIRCIASDGSFYASDFDPDGNSIFYQKGKYSSPVLVSAESTSEGVKFTWNAVPDAQKYRLYYMPEGGKWTKIIDTTATSYTWTNVKEGTKGHFTVRCISADGKSFVSDYDDPGMVFEFKPIELDTPQLSSVTNASNGVVIAWDAVPDAKQYRVFYKTGSANWKKLADTTSTSYTWTGAKSGTKYTFTVRCLSANGSMYTSDYNDIGLSITYKSNKLATPMLTSLINTSEGIALSWEPVAGAIKYRVFYQIAGTSSWTKLADTTGVGYVWDDAQENVRYAFTVRCIASDGSYASDYDTTGQSIIYKPSAPAEEGYPLANPNASVTVAPNGVAISWDAVAGAEMYRIYYSTESEDGKWVKLVDTASTAYTWTGAEEGKTYYITVRCISADGKAFMSWYNSGKSIEYTPTDAFDVPASVTAKSANNGVVISWDAVEGAQKYRVYYRYSSSTKWTAIADTTSTMYTWTGAMNGLEYYFAVRCLTSDGATTKSSDGKDYTESALFTYKAGLLDSPDVQVTNEEDSPNEVKITWNAVEGAEKYRVFYKTETSGWKKLADTSLTEYIWTGAEGGCTYTFTVRCISADAKTYTSDFKTEEHQTIKIDKLAMPSVKASSKDEGVVISWDEVPGAYRYRVAYRLNETTNWTTLVDTTSTSYVWVDASPNTTYYITVYCVSYDGSFITSNYNTSTRGVSVKVNWLRTPKLKSASNVPGGVEITWDAVARAQKYRVFYKTGSNNWKSAGDTTDTSFIWTDAKPSTEYFFTVRCISADGKAYTSEFDEVGLRIMTVDSSMATILAKGSYSSASSMLTLINAMRTGSEAWYWESDNVTKTTLGNVGQLTYSDSLERIAKQRAAELVLRYSADYRPDGTPASSLECGNVRSACEIIAKGYSSVQDAFDYWAAANGTYSSQANRRQLLNANYHSVGIACFQYNGTTYWVLEFGK